MSEVDRAFGTLEEVYEHLESEILSYRYPHQVARLLAGLGGAFEKNGMPGKAETARWEAVAFESTLRANGVREAAGIKDANGTVSRVPTYDHLGDEGIAHLKRRLAAAKHPALRARYAHILWDSRKSKHQDFAKKAVDAYIELTRLYEEKDLEVPEGHYGLDVLECVTCAYALADIVHYREADAQDEVLRLIRSFNWASSSTFALRAQLVELVLLNRKVFPISQLFPELIKVVQRVAESRESKGDRQGAITMLQLAVRLANATGVDSKPWKKRIGEEYEKLMLKAGKGDLTRQAFCLEAIKAYKNAGVKEKAEELEKLLPEIAESMEFHEVSAEVDVSQAMQEYKRIAGEVSQWPGEDIVEYLALSPDLLPKKATVEAIMNGHAGGFALLELCPVSPIDTHGNVPAHYATPEEKRWYQTLWYYQLLLRNFKLPFIHICVLESVKTGKLTADIVIDFLGRHSWLGKGIRREIGGQALDYKWLDALEPGLREYFGRMHEYIRTGEEPNVLLAVDSLVLKFEGILRDLCRLCGAPTSRGKQDRAERPTSSARLLNDLLEEDAVVQHIDPDTLLFLKFLLVEQTGYNLRHKVAHALMADQEYGLEHAHLLVLAILRLAPYDVVRKPSKGDEPTED